MLGEWRTSHGSHSLRHFPQCLTSFFDVVERSRNHVGVKVAVRYVSPDRKLESASFKSVAIELQRHSETIEGHDQIARHLLNIWMDARFRGGHPGIDCRWDRFAKLGEARGATVVSGQRENRIVCDVRYIQHLTEHLECAIVLRAKLHGHDERDRARRRTNQLSA